MTDERDICERLEDQSIDGAIYLRINAAKEIRALRHYVARLEEDLAIADNETERLRKYSSKQALDIVTLGQEVGRLRAALGKIANEAWNTHAEFCHPDGCDSPGIARAALAEKEEK